MGFEPALVSYKHTLNGLYGSFNHSATEGTLVRELEYQVINALLGARQWRMICLKCFLPVI